MISVMTSQAESIENRLRFCANRSAEYGFGCVSALENSRPWLEKRVVPHDRRRMSRRPVILVHNGIINSLLMSTLVPLCCVTTGPGTL